MDAIYHWAGLALAFLIFGCRSVVPMGTHFEPCLGMCSST
jgi:hypothetical protein